LVSELIILARGPSGLIQIRSLDPDKAVSKGFPIIRRNFFKISLKSKYLSKVGILPKYKVIKVIIKGVKNCN